MTIPRPEFPNPQFERKQWQNLNGVWDFAFDFGNSGLAGGMLEKSDWDRQITVPFCPESRLSGVGYTDFIPAVWYRRTVQITDAQLEGRVFLCFGAVDYETHVYVNGKEAGVHFGGYTSFRFDITALLRAGENVIIVNAQDDTRSRRIPSGKQSDRLASYGCMYTRTTGIWQTVWLEFTPRSYIKAVRLYPDAANGTLSVEAQVAGKGVLRADACYAGSAVGTAAKTVDTLGRLELTLSETHLWAPGDGRLYDLTLTFEGDEVRSYFGLRDLAIDGYAFRINGKSVFQRLVLDQGFYPDGIYTARDEAALVHDIEMSMAAGFNGARLHEKVFEPRFLYHCDRLGYLVWGEYPNWGIDHSDPTLTPGYLEEWCEAVLRDCNHPAIVGWCPFNETWDCDGRRRDPALLRTVYRMTKRIDPTRPCIDTSGNFHVETDIYDVHDYEQDPTIFKPRYDKLMTEGTLHDAFPDIQHYPGGICFISEYGGIRWSVNADNGDAWGYGNAPKTEEEYFARYKGLTDALLDNDRMFAFCYTQLTDVEQEQNGVYTYDRQAKFDIAKYHAINSRKAAIED